MGNAVATNCCRDDNTVGAGIDALKDAKQWTAESESKAPGPQVGAPAAVKEAKEVDTTPPKPTVEKKEPEEETQAKKELEAQEATKAKAAAEEEAQPKKATEEVEALAKREKEEKARAELDAKKVVAEQVEKATTSLPGVSVVFEVPGSGEKKTVQLTRKPVGIDFHYTAPIKVDSVFPKSHAEELGIEKGWIVRSIHGEDMGGKDFKTKFDHFAKALSTLPGSAELLFRLPDGSEKMVSVKQRPVGFDFHMAVPITVDSVEPGTHAAELGIQKGWAISKINGEEMNAKDIQISYRHLLDCFATLPQK